MENDNESSSKNNVIVTGIVNFSASPYNVNKKAYSFKMEKKRSKRVLFSTWVQHVQTSRGRVHFDH